MNYAFNLLDQPWLPCVDEKNQLKMMSLLEVISQAPKLKTIQADLPIITGSLYLFLIAFTKAALRPRDDSDWEAIWRQGMFPMEEITTYVKKWKNRFDLFDPDHPFYQDPKFGTREKDLRNLKPGTLPTPKGLSGLLLHLASGDNATLFDHSLDEHPQLYTPAETVRLLIMLQSNSLGGMSSASISKDKYYKDSPFGRGVLFLGNGENLFQTIMLNLAPEDFDALETKGEDHPCWEQQNPYEPERFTPNGLLDLMTWQSRRIMLVPEENDGQVMVKQCYTAPGLGLTETFNNPFYHIRYVKKGSQQTTTPLRFQEGRSLWRDSAAILDVHSKNLEIALALHWHAYLRNQEILDKQNVQLELFGMCTEPGQKKVYFYAQQSFIAPAHYLENQTALETLQLDLNLAETVRSNLYLAVRELARFKVAPRHDEEGRKPPDPKEVDRLIQHLNAEQVYWSRLEPAFYAHLVSLPESAQARETWQQELRAAARKALSFAANQVGTDPAGLKARAKAEQSLNRLLFAAFNAQS